MIDENNIPLDAYSVTYAALVDAAARQSANEKTDLLNSNERQADQFNPLKEDYNPSGASITREPMRGFKPITTQAELDAVIESRLKRERKKLLRLIVKMIAGLQDLCRELE